MEGGGVKGEGATQQSIHAATRQSQVKSFALMATPCVGLDFRAGALREQEGERQGDGTPSN